MLHRRDFDEPMMKGQGNSNPYLYGRSAPAGLFHWRKYSIGSVTCQPCLIGLDKYMAVGYHSNTKRYLARYTPEAVGGEA